MARHQVFEKVNVRTLMFNVTKHEIVPPHKALDTWADDETIERIKRTPICRAFEGEPKERPGAKFIGPTGSCARLLDERDARDVDVSVL